MLTNKFLNKWDFIHFQNCFQPVISWSVADVCSRWAVQRRRTYASRARCNILAAGNRLGLQNKVLVDAVTAVPRAIVGEIDSTMELYTAVNQKSLKVSGGGGRDVMALSKVHYEGFTGFCWREEHVGKGLSGHSEKRSTQYDSQYEYYADI